VSPITPPLRPQQFPPPRQSHAYTTHPEQTIIAPPAPAPIEFDANPDVLALKSTLSILQMQSARAKRDMVALQTAKTAALADPAAFLADLKGGAVRVGGPVAGAGGGGSLGDDSDSDSDADLEDADGGGTARMDVDKGATGASTVGPGTGSEHNAMDVDSPPHAKRQKPWNDLPGAQNIYRMPPINWGQYAVAGESLDRLHNEQATRPAQGTPATVTPDGRYEFKGNGKQEELVGIAAPYDPLRDKLDKKKPKTPNRQG
jgi:hypothetical protein